MLRATALLKAAANGKRVTSVGYRKKIVVTGKYDAVAGEFKVGFPTHDWSAWKRQGREIVGFWRETEANGWASQWYEGKEFTVFGHEVKTAEHGMMFAKAVVFGDAEIARQILVAETPKAAKKLGREVANFTVELWNSIARDVLYHVNIQKFASDPVALAKLLETGESALAEMSPYDPLYGTGFKEDSVWPPETEWGENRLGQVLEEVRSHFLSARMVVVSGDLLSPPNFSGKTSWTPWIVQQVNCTGVRAEGLSAKIAARFSDAGNAYLHRSASDENEKYATKFDAPGTIKVAENVKSTDGDAAPLTIVHLFGQGDYRSLESQTKKPRPFVPAGLRESDGQLGEVETAEDRLRWFNQGLRAIAALENAPTELFVPFKIGCGWGGGDWAKYKEALRLFAEESDIRIVVLKP